MSPLDRVLSHLEHTREGAFVVAEVTR